MNGYFRGLFEATWLLITVWVKITEKEEEILKKLQTFSQ